jgi:hypothetical protein
VPIVKRRNRGGCAFSTKWSNIEDADYKGAIVANIVPGPVSGIGLVPGSPDSTIPFFFVTQDAAALLVLRSNIYFEDGRITHTNPFVEMRVTWTPDADPVPSRRR